MSSGFLIYAGNESKSVPARDLDDCRDNVRNLTERRRGNAFFSFIRSAYREAVIWIFSAGRSGVDPDRDLLIDPGETTGRCPDRW